MQFLVSHCRTPVPTSCRSRKDKPSNRRPFSNFSMLEGGENFLNLLPFTVLIMLTLRQEVFAVSTSNESFISLLETWGWGYPLTKHKDLQFHPSVWFSGSKYGMLDRDLGASLANSKHVLLLSEIWSPRHKWMEEIKADSVLCDVLT